METIVTKLQEFAATYGMKLVGAILILLIGRLVAKLVRTIIRSLMEKSKVDPALVSFVGSLSYIAMMTFIIIAALSKLNIQTASFVAVLGAAGLAVGLALQGSLANFAAGVLMLIFKPFKVGDYIEGGGTSGVVEEIEIFTTQLKTPDNKKVIVPNAGMTGSNIINYSAKDCRRVDMVFGVGYGDDLDKVKTAINDVIGADARVLEDPAPTVGVAELGDSSVNFAVRPWCKTADYWDVFFAINEAMKRRFDTDGISIPFPQRDVHLIKDGDA
ncbi:MAG: mechanosensitive ion channel [Verrucomicrobia bacterium]|jgi:small conductance mechanosensitive channel|nr:mechanosensitive ion channel [Verrucomicrobiota bacterium]MBT7066980.1 mechanosensitive ion channel [Verrucomicrobiota bacterium]MBT7699989.1 mechanosensitive ion channel [Verrucomicrobiota bacterium]